MQDVDWADVALCSEIAYSSALGSVPTTHAGFTHLHNEAVPWGSDFNCAVGVRLTGLASFDRVVTEVERIHHARGLDHPDRYDVHPPALDEAAWSAPLAERGYRLRRSLWFCAETLAGDLAPGFALYTPGADEYIAWYHTRQQAQAWYNEADWQRLRPLQERFARAFRPYWLLRDGARVGWVYCGAVDGYGSLFDVWIEPPHRGQGLGRTLIDAVRAEGSKQGLRHLLLRTSEARRGFYEKCGFRECLSSSTIRLGAGEEG